MPVVKLKSSIREWALVSLLFLSFGSEVQAQDQPEIVKTELITITFNGMISPGFFYRNGGEIVQLAAGTQGISPPVFYQGPRRLEFFRSKNDLNPPEKDKEKPKPAVVATLPKTSDRALLVFAFPNKKAKTPGVKAYPVDDRSLKEGDYRIFNFSKQKVFLIFQDKNSQVAVDSGKVAEITGAAWSRKMGSVNVSLGIQNAKQKRIDSVYSSVWGHRPERRSFLFAFDSGDKNRPVLLKKFYDVPAFKTEKRKTAEKE
ncbi:MAG: hypothetical protein ACSHYB_06040 [Roseibacillus sp.]